MKKFILLIFTVAVSINSLFLCGNEFHEKSPKAMLNFYYYGVGGGGPAEITVTKNLVQRFMEQNPEVQVNIVRVPFSTDGIFDYFQMLLTTAPTASDIDILTVDGAWALNLKDNLVDLAPYTEKENFDDFFPNVIKCFTYENEKKQLQLFAYPWYCDIGLLFYREDLLKKYNISVPKTWKDLEAAAKHIQDEESKEGNEIAGYVWQGYSYEGLTCNALEWIHSNGGGDIINTKHSITINNQNAKESLKMAADWIGNISPPNVLYMKEDDSLEFFKRGNAVFARGWPFFYYSCNRDDSNVIGKINFTQIPHGKLGKNSGVLGGWGLAVNKASSNKELAIKLVKFLISSEALKEKAQATSELPAVKSFYSSKDFFKIFPKFKEIYQAICNGFSRPIQRSYPNYNYLSKEFDIAVYNVLNKKQTPEESLRNLADKLHKMGFKPINAE